MTLFVFLKDSDKLNHLAITKKLTYLKYSPAEGGLVGYALFEHVVPLQSIPSSSWFCIWSSHICGNGDTLRYGFSGSVASCSWENKLLKFYYTIFALINTTGVNLLLSVLVPVLKSE